MKASRYFTNQQAADEKVFDLSSNASCAENPTLLLDPLPYGDPGRVMMVWTAYPSQGQWRSVSSLPDYRDWREQSSTFEDMAVFNISRSFVEGEPEVVYGSVVSPTLPRIRSS